jgi:demethylmenaquinone methyltransferase/2-methoxy-6-polyprenyl-1,4-benzoquinol methylase
MSQDYRAYNDSSFRKIAPFYDFICLPFIRLRERVVALSGARVGHEVLDVCTGTGAQAFAFGRHGCRVTGIDRSPDMLKLAEEKNRYVNVTFQSADATELPFEDERFAISSISLALHDMPREVRPLVLEEMKRVSKTVVVVDYHIPENRVERWLHVNFTGLYELGYYRDFARQNLKELLQQHHLKIIREGYGLVNVIRILVCEAG